VPHFVCIKSPSIVFPDCCAYCKSTTSSSAFSQPYSKISGKGFPVVLTGQTWPAMLPACDRCARWFSKVRKAYFFFGIGGLICGTLGFIAFNIMLEFMGLFVNDARIYLPLVLALCSLIAWSILWAVRASELRKLRVVYIGPKEIVFATTNQRYGEMLADLNNSTAKYARFLTRWH
jgi:hypothetical protein